ncbi:alpha-glucosidase [Tolypothrix tenuis PCC 7101]|uniref:Alpha-glucosidase n=1 Tax=Tolypothrix tenuis PCC 7101 TaxID=231146 RepID=A0A1Z4MZX3_9CYAN|nr:alpha-glucosidase [Tolypothrix tenuis PCC 7101]BAZ77044.1 alpha-glucosidase [Aulosira laxa NIES-50]
MDRFKQIKLKLKFLFGSLFYTSYAPKAFLYTRQRNSIECEFIKLPTEPGFDQPGKLLRAEAKARGANFYFEMAELEVCFLTEDLVRINWKPGIPPIPYGIQHHEWPEVANNLEQTENNYSVSSHALKVIAEIDGSLKFCDRSGQVIRATTPMQKRRLDSSSTTADGRTHLWLRETGFNAEFARR